MDAVITTYYLVITTYDGCRYNNILSRYYTDISLLWGKYTECLSPGSREFFGVGKYNISGIPGNLGTNVLVYFPRSNEITVMLHFTRKNAWKIDPNSSDNVTPADYRDVMNNVERIVKCPSLFQSDVLSIPKISAVNITFAVPAMSGQYNVTQYLAR